MSQEELGRDSGDCVHCGAEGTDLCDIWRLLRIIPDKPEKLEGPAEAVTHDH